jgi:SAM-dependent methyltransferase
MTRTLEPELMTEQDQAAAYAAADLSEVNEPIAGWFQARFPPLAPGARLLDIGCGTADLTIRLVRAYPGITALGIDGSEAMLDHGRDLVNKAGLTSRIANNLLHHLSAPGPFWAAARHCAKPGAPVLVGDLRRPPDPDAAARIVEQYACGAPPPLRRDFLNSLHAAYTAEEVRQQLREAGCSGFTVEEVGPLHLVAWGYGA